MGVVNNPIHNVAGIPGEGRVTLGAPHLVAALDLADHYATPRAGPAVLRQQFGRGDILGFTLML